MTRSVTVVGSVNLDLVATLDRLPDPGETLTATGFTQAAGGKGANQALAAQRCGADVRLLAAVGSDDAAGAALALLRAGGVDLTGVRTVDSPTGRALIEVDADGETTIVVVPGANADLMLNAGEIAGADSVLTVLEVPDAAVRAAVEEATGLVVLNAAPARAVPADLLRRVDLLVVNRTEYALLGPDADLARAVVVTHGADGAVLRRNGRDVARAVSPQVSAVDGTAAGDAFVGAAVVALLDGASDADLLARGCAAGALTVTRPGAQPALPTAREIDEVLTSP